MGSIVEGDELAALGEVSACLVRSVASDSSPAVVGVC
jgi:hypothetical protein